MQTTPQILVTELSPHEVDYDLSAAPRALRETLTEESVAVQALATLGCSANRQGQHLYVTLPTDTETVLNTPAQTSSLPGERISDLDYMRYSALQQWASSGRLSELSTGVIEAMANVLGLSKPSHLAVRRHATYVQ